MSALLRVGMFVSSARDSAGRRWADRDVADVVVIGTGAGGAPVIARLAAAGLHVVALEAGRAWTPSTDFATDERAQSGLYWPDERLSAGNDPVHFGRNNSGIGVGGSTLHYTAYTPRPRPDDFHLQTEFGVGVDWPFGYDALEPYLSEVEEFIGVSGPSPYPWGPARSAAYPLPPLPLNGAAQLMERGCAALGIRTSPAANAALSEGREQPHVGRRPACTNRGFCEAGCSTGAKSSMDVTYLPYAVAHGAEIRAHCFVTGFEHDRQGRICAVIYREYASEHADASVDQHDATERADADADTTRYTERRQRCHAVFLCAGAIETPRLLLMQKLANSSGHVGRHFMAHTGLQLWGRFQDEVRPNKGIPGALISEDFHRPTDADFAGGYLLQSIGVMPVTYASQFTRACGVWGNALVDHLQHYNHVAGINILGECLPYETNYLELSDERDARGLYKPRVHFTLGENEQRLTAHAERTMREVWNHAGAQDVWSYKRTAHIIGTCRMGRNGDSAVVNADGQSFDVPNLYVSDNSTFPSALSVNPALTIMAIALRTADRYLEHARVSAGAGRGARTS